MRHALLLLVISFLLCLPAFADSPVVLVIPKGERVHYWKWVKQGALRAGKERGVTVIYRGPRISDDYNAQLGIIQQGIEDKVDAIVIAPSHATLPVSLLAEARRQGILVVVIDSAIEFSDTVSFVATDNYRAGQDAARFLLPMIDSRGTVLLLRYKQDNASTVAREKGVLDILGSVSEITTVDSGYIGVSVGKAYHRVAGIMEENPDIKAILSPGEATTVGCLRALKEMGLAGKVKVVGFDYTSEVREYLKQKEIHGVVLQQPYEMGYLGVMAAVDAINSKPVEKRIRTSVSIATKIDDIDVEEID